ncbi:glutathionylspermidine synthase family protein [Cohnella herbarum]|uniref:Glutathionylspermidine synthase family protein n=1 Tax=Cohnella herbarum TaxID=2728023 RepID=A0A7Z2ZQY4_9BACL|nr:glutathionylspermidine synthase family protein [Cohnella herbarum]QJD87517.1 glutathionylspermidine synthase family protein [Cohnella herbarum]
MRKMFHMALTHDEVFQGTIAEAIPYHRMYGKEYCLPSFLLYAPDEVQRIAIAAERVNGVYDKALRFAQRYLPDEFFERFLGIPPSLIPSSRVEVPYHAVSRQDWIVNGELMKCIENNSDTPSGIPETAWLAEALIGRCARLGNPSEGMRAAIQEAFRQLLGHYADSGLTGTLAFSCYDWHIEDKTNTLYVMEAVRELGYPAEFVPLDKLEIVPEDGLYSDGRRIDVLYRLYPLEYLVHDREEASDFPIGEALLKLVEDGKLGLINPAQSIITQSKGFMALIWSLYERNHLTEEAVGFTLFGKEECEAIENYLLPTYFEKTVFEATGAPYVSKGFWGREGKGVTLFDSKGDAENPSEWGSDDDTKIREYYENQPKVYQLRCEMEAAEVPTENGKYSGYVLTGAYVIGGRYAGLLPRIGEAVTGDMAYYCPAAVEIREES